MYDSVSDAFSAFSLDPCLYHLGCQDLIRKLRDFSCGWKAAALWYRQFGTYLGPTLWTKCGSDWPGYRVSTNVFKME